MKKKLEILLEILAKKHYTKEIILEATLLPLGAKEPPKMMNELIRIAKESKNETSFNREMRRLTVTMM